MPALPFLALLPARVWALLIGTVLAVGLFFGWGEWRHRAGVMQERAAWEVRVERERAALARERAATQARIDQLVSERILAATNWALERADLEAEIEKEKADAAVDGACPPALSRGLSERLDRIGR
jgi:predicted negative regulator of RcsB-dependent stress response